MVLNKHGKVITWYDEVNKQFMSKRHIVVDPEKVNANEKKTIFAVDIRDPNDKETALSNECEVFEV